MPGGGLLYTYPMPHVFSLRLPQPFAIILHYCIPVLTFPPVVLVAQNLCMPPQLFSVFSELFDRETYLQTGHMGSGKVGITLYKAYFSADVHVDTCCGARKGKKCFLILAVRSIT